MVETAMREVTVVLNAGWGCGLTATAFMMNAVSMVTGWKTTRPVSWPDLAQPSGKGLAQIPGKGEESR